MALIMEEIRELERLLGHNYFPMFNMPKSREERLKFLRNYLKQLKQERKKKGLNV